MSAASCEPGTPSTPHTPLLNSSKFEFDDVFDEPQNPSSHCEKGPAANAMNFDEMSNCLALLVDHSSVNGDNVVSSLENIGNGYKHSDNNYDSTINYCDENEFGLVFFS